MLPLERWFGGAKPGPRAGRDPLLRTIAATAALSIGWTRTAAGWTGTTAALGTTGATLPLSAAACAAGIVAVAVAVAANTGWTTALKR